MTKVTPRGHLQGAGCHSQESAPSCSLRVIEEMAGGEEAAGWGIASLPPGLGEFLLSFWVMVPGGLDLGSASWGAGPLSLPRSHQAGGNSCPSSRACREHLNGLDQLFRAFHHPYFPGSLDSSPRLREAPLLPTRSGGNPEAQVAVGWGR